MIVCPNCGKVATDLQIRGPVLYVEGVVTINDDNLLVAVSPLRAIQTIKVGDELTNDVMLLSCPTCEYTGVLKSYKIVDRCCLTGEPTEYSVMTPFGMLPVLERFAEEIRHIFTEERANWHTSNITNVQELFNV